jgi:hypothetical protein
LNENGITADSDFSFPDGVYLAAGDEVKKEIYVFLVTSINDENYAQSIMDMLYHNNISKGTVEKLEKNWGVQMIEVNIIPPTSR